MVGRPVLALIILGFDLEQPMILVRFAIAILALALVSIALSLGEAHTKPEAVSAAIILNR